MSRVTISVAIAVLALALVIAPTASAHPTDPPGVEPSTAGADEPTWADLGSIKAGEGSSSGGFDWGDAAVGAVGAMLVLGTGVAGFAAVHQGRGERGAATIG